MQKIIVNYSGTEELMRIQNPTNANVAFYLHNILQPLGAYAPLGLFITE